MSPDRRAGDRRRPAWPPERRRASLPLLVMLLTFGLALSPAQAADASGHQPPHRFPAAWICLLVGGLARLGFGAAARRVPRAAPCPLGPRHARRGLGAALSS